MTDTTSSNPIPEEAVLYLKRTRRTTLLLTIICLVLVGCSDENPTQPVTRQAVAGNYAAVSFTLRENGTSTDLLAAGASVNINLLIDGTTTGRLFVPGGDDDGSDLDKDLAGTWSLAGTIVRLQHAADTFLRDLALTFADGRLTGELSSIDGTIAIVLQKN